MKVDEGNMIGIYRILCYHVFWLIKFI